MDRSFYFSLLFLFVVLGCSNDDDGASNPDISSSELSGSWNLINVSGGFQGIDQDFDPGTVIWVFNETNNTIAVTNNNTDNSIEDMLPTGTYDYALVSLQQVREIVIDGVNRGNLEVTAGQLIINEQFRDGFRFVFNR